MYILFIFVTSLLKIKCGMYEQRSALEELNEMYNCVDKSHKAKAS